MDETYDQMVGKNGLRFFADLFRSMQMGKSISLNILGTWTIRNGEIKGLVHPKVSELMAVNGGHDITLQPMPPFLYGQLDCKEFPVADVVVLLCQAELLGEEGA